MGNPKRPGWRTLRVQSDKKLQGAHRMLPVQVMVATRVQDVFSSKASEAMDEAIRLVLERL